MKVKLPKTIPVIYGLFNNTANSTAQVSQETVQGGAYYLQPYYFRMFLLCIWIIKMHSSNCCNVHRSFSPWLCHVRTTMTAVISSWWGKKHSAWLHYKTEAVHIQLLQRAQQVQMDWNTCVWVRKIIVPGSAATVQQRKLRVWMDASATTVLCFLH
jgi:hypothetical protein